MVDNHFFFFLDNLVDNHFINNVSQHYSKLLLFGTSTIIQLFFI